MSSLAAQGERVSTNSESLIRDIEIKVPTINLEEFFNLSKLLTRAILRL